MERNIAVDSGKYATKAAMLLADGRVRAITFRSKLDNREINGSFGINKRGTHSVVYEGKPYVLGEGANTTDDSNTSKADDFHMIATYAAIGMLTDNGDVVNAAAGCPLYMYDNISECTKYKDKLFPAGKQVTITIDGAEKRFAIRKGIILPEGSGVVTLNIRDERINNDIVGVIDIGGLNCNGCIYKDGSPLLFTKFTNNMGGNTMTRNIKSRLEEEFAGNPIPSAVMEKAILRGYINGDAEVKEKSQRVISEVRHDHVQAILKDCAEHQWNLRMMPVIFTGGTSLLLKEEIGASCSTAQLDLITEDVAYANVRGFLYALSGRR